jgi:hypothetical protein
VRSQTASLCRLLALRVVSLPLSNSDAFLLPFPPKTITGRLFPMTTPETIRSATDCHPCLRYVPSPMSPGRTKGMRGGPGKTRTSDLRFRKPLLYPAELRDQVDVASFFQRVGKSCSVFAPLSVARTASLAEACAVRKRAAHSSPNGTDTWAALCCIGLRCRPRSLQFARWDLAGPQISCRVAPCAGDDDDLAFDIAHVVRS